MSKNSERLEYLIGDKNLEILKNSKIIIFGLGGVGSFAAEALTRSFIGSITIVDYDIVNISNINRQLVALNSTIKRKKVDVMYDRIKDINSECKVFKIDKKLMIENIDEFNLKEYDYVIDAIDDISAKLTLIRHCLMNKIKIVSSMGMANKLDPTKVKITKLYDTRFCAFARKLRRELKNINSARELPVIYSEEFAIRHDNDNLGSTSFVPPVAGITVASYVVRRLLDIKINYRRRDDR
ncbi:tRNA threonylcarbamoyladenosine dehydratase [Oceanivirga miroungae]|uniref:UBA/THIF-type NAD/FAD binding protein n=1 Tax=Oceanivirga miroungae TaxID=1130046 RepID=A0A6I8MEJ6_9FUSO|nr:tRNA threonylcarbamoyladenosine dehydratase [Oceanivirga miroungae]VWL85638.1 UBA/THIF-type NAD/FAD binding protein [Oceanivirga miroungae]